MKARSRFVLIIAMLLMLSLACAQAGEVLTPAEATERARAGSGAGEEVGPGIEGAQFQRDQEIEFIGSGFLVSLYNQPGDTIARSHISRGSSGTVLDSQTVEGEAWYHVNTSAGRGWVRAEFLQAVEETGETAGTGSEGEEAGEEPPAETTDDGPRPGDTVYLVGRSFLINLIQEPGGIRIIAGQERGVQVEITDVTEVDGERWYRVDAPGGTGWVPAENISTEAP